MTIQKQWHPESWRAFPASQQPFYDDQANLRSALTKIKSFPPLVFAGEVEKLKKRLAVAAQGGAFVLQAGDCAERFDQCTPDILRKKIGILMHMSLMLGARLHKPVVAIGRIAGQYAKPRSYDYEKCGDISLPIYRGDIINSNEPTVEARRPHPDRLVEAYVKSSMTLNFIRALFDGEFSDLDQAKAWGVPIADLPASLRREYEDRRSSIEQGWQLMQTQKIDSTYNAVWDGEIYVSHEGLLLDYEEAMTRHSQDFNSHYNTGAHFLWIGNRTRSLNEAHVEYFRGIENPIGIKIDSGANPDEVAELVRLLNPRNAWGKITLIPRYGVGSVAAHLPKLIRTIEQNKLRVLWSVDPMHGNVYLTKDGVKTRRFETICEELELTADTHKQMGTHLAGLHLELTGEPVTECVGGATGLNESGLSEHYETFCDPRLNAAQGLEVSMRMSELLSTGFLPANVHRLNRGHPTDYEFQNKK